MLSRMLQMHPDVLSLSEFWRVFPQEEGSSDVWNLFSQAEASIAAGEISGAEFWRRITATDSDIDAMAGAGILRKDAREAFDPTPGMPSICRLLATLTEDVDSLYAKLALVVPAWPRQSTAEHCRALFAELAAALGRSAVVERTGGSASLMPMLRQQFPEARYVFLHRDGPDSSLSMSRNPLYRLAVMRIVADAVTSGSTAISPD